MLCDRLPDANISMIAKLFLLLSYSASSKLLSITSTTDVCANVSRCMSDTRCDCLNRLSVDLVCRSNRLIRLILDM